VIMTLCHPCFGSFFSITKSLLLFFKFKKFDTVTLILLYVWTYDIVVFNMAKLHKGELRYAPKIAS